MRLTINDRYIKGTVAFDRFGDKARMSYMTSSSSPALPLSARYKIDGTEWRIVEINRSQFNPNIVNVDLESEL
jgi:hypothetical protein